jgi:hypothetical protein
MTAPSLGQLADLDLGLAQALQADVAFRAHV